MLKLTIEKKIEKILLVGGNKIDNRYLILSNDFFEDFNPYMNIPSAIDRYFDVEGTFGECFCTFDDKYGFTELISAVDGPEEILCALEEEE